MVWGNGLLCQATKSHSAADSIIFADGVDSQINNSCALDDSYAFNSGLYECIHSHARDHHYLLGYITAHSNNTATTYLPILVIANRFILMVLLSKERIMVPIDFSEKSIAALHETLDFADTESIVHAVYVLKPLEATAPGVIWDSANTEHRTANIQSLFDEKFPNSKDQGITFSIKKGDPDAEIVDLAESENITLIVIPSKGRTGISRFLMGSVSENVIRCAHCPVIVLKD